jgi:hypothetical protein
MKSLLAYTTILAGLAIPLAASAQDAPALPEPPQLDQSRVARASEVGHRDFVDPGNQQAARFAKERGISVGQATSQLKRQAALTRFIERLKQRHPDKFSFVRVEGDQIIVGLTDPSADIRSLLPPGLVNATPVKAAYSEQGTHAKLDQLTGQLAAAKLADVTVGLNSDTGRVEFLTKKSRAALEAAIKSGAVKVDGEYVILDDEIVVTADLYGGRAYNPDPSLCSVSDPCAGTTGFSLVSTTTPTRYVSTAGHVVDHRARYSTNKDSTYSSGGTSLGAVTDIRNTVNLDIQYAPPASSSDIPNPYFWDGWAYLTVTDWTYPTEGVEFCKYGRVTLNKCGIHDTTLWYSNAQWNVKYLRRIKNNGSGSGFSKTGDSGGPVFYGNWALGWIHGHNSNFDVLYTGVGVQEPPIGCGSDRT